MLVIESVPKTKVIELPPELMVLDGLIEVSLSRREHMLVLPRCGSLRFLFVFANTRKLLIKPCCIPAWMDKS